MASKWAIEFLQNMYYVLFTGVKCCLSKETKTSPVLQTVHKHAAFYHYALDGALD